jgi:RNA polymerase sigma factor (TIGR02999 family)
VTDSTRTRVTELVTTLGTCSGSELDEAAAELLPAVYEELRRLAGGYLRLERPDHTLQATELVHEAYLRLVDGSKVDWAGRTHFLAVGAGAMRRVLIDHARRRLAQKRGSAPERVTLGDSIQRGPAPGMDPVDLLSLNDALERLAAVDERGARVVELRFFGGLSAAEIAEVLGVSRRTVQGDWAHARAWLREELSGEDDS